MNRNIFRSYDIRGKYPTDINEDIAYSVGYAYGKYVLSINEQTVVIGKDVRFSSESLYNAFITGLNDACVNVKGLDLSTTPYLYFASIFLHAPAVMITASHNPKDENGFKFNLRDNKALYGKDLQNFYDTVKFIKYTKQTPKYEKINIYNEYKKALFNEIKFGQKKLKVIIDPANASTLIFLKDIVNNLPIEAVFINDEIDPSFPNHHPDPSVKANLVQLSKNVIEAKADFGVSFDGDGDRIGVISNDGSFIPADKLMILYWKHLKNVKKKTLYDVKCSVSLKKELDKIGVESICYKTGSIYTRTAVNDYNLPFGGEFSGHLFFRDKYLGIDDGIYAFIRLVEIYSSCENSISDDLVNVDNYYSEGEIKILSNDECKFRVVEDVKSYLKKQYSNIIEIDGIRIENDDYMICFRASNTGANLILIIEASTKELYEKKKSEMLSIINKYNN